MTRTGSTSLLLFGLTLVSGCDSGGDGSSGAGGSAATTGGSGAGAPATGGVTTGGAGTSTGGAPAAQGGSSQGGKGPTGGAAPVTGGTANGGGGQAPITGGTSATGGSAAGGGAGAPAGGSGGGSSADPCAGALFCDDFEDYDKGKSPGAPWAERVSSGTVSVDDAQQVSGSKSVKFTTEAKDGTKTAFLRLKSDSVFPVDGNLFYGRMMVRLESAPTASVHWTLLQSTGTVPNQTYRSQYRYGGQHPIMDGGTFTGSQLMANYETPDSYSGNGPSSDCWVHANMKVLPTGAWVCVEWEFDGPNDAMRFWMNDQALEDLSVSGTGQGCVSQPETYRWTAPTFSELEIGWESYQNDAARTLYIDDLVVSKTRVGCPK